jgi:hypothetical protein
LSGLAGLSFAFVLAGFFFGESRWLGSSLLGVGAVLAVVDMIAKKRNQSRGWSLSFRPAVLSSQH